MPLDRHAARLLAMQAASTGGSAHPSAKARRDALVELARMAADPPSETVEREAQATSCGRPVRRYTPASSGRGALLYLHGGGWVAGDLETHDGTCAALAAAGGFSLFALDYRRAPEAPFPAAVDDAVAALAWLRTEASGLGLDAARIGIGGDSAGANIAAGACLQNVAARAAPLALQLLICPILDPLRADGSRTTFRQGYFIEAERLSQDLADYLGRGSARDPRVSPLRAERLDGAPPTLIHTAEYDPFRDEALAYADRLRAAGVSARATVHAGMIHYFYALPRAIPAARAVVEAIGREAGAALDG